MNANIVNLLRTRAMEHPNKDALIVAASGKRTSFAELDFESDGYARGFQKIGIRKGMRVAVLVPPNENFFYLAFALLKLGAVMVLIDPGMGLKSMLRCLEELKPDAFVGTPKAVALKVLTRAMKSAKIQITVGSGFFWGYFWGGFQLSKLRTPLKTPFDIVDCGPSEEAAVLFTTGSTGLAKGAVYQHSMFRAQVDVLKNHYQIGEDEIDLPTFPLFALFDPLLSMTAVLPDMDPRRPGFVNPQKIFEPIRKYRITNMFGSPALINRVGQEGERLGVKLPTLRRVISCGAPVPPRALRSFSSMLRPEVEIFTPYGATEALPVSSIGSSEILTETAAETQRGAGTCVGRPMPKMDVNIIGINDQAISNWNDDLLLETGEVGEIVVRGDVVTQQYCARDQATLLAKITDGDRVWHRMGDLGRFDSQGRLWFLGRKSQRVSTQAGDLFTDAVEGIFNEHPAVFRSALVGVPKSNVKEPAHLSPSSPVLCVELKKNVAHAERSKILEELKMMAKGHPQTRTIEQFLFHPKFPVDIRHNAKIFREQLAQWAGTRSPESHSPEPHPS